jgi:C1A family cysteine protease
MKKLNSFISRFLAVCLSGTITYLSVPDVEGLVISDDDFSDEPSIISIVEGEPSIYGETSIIYLDEDNNVITPNLIPDSTDKATLYPTSYDLRDYGYVTSVKNQEDTSTCWAHATLASAESNMIMKGLADQSIDLSESHLVWFSLGKTSTDWNDPLFNDGYDYGSYAYDRGGNHRNSQYTLARGSGIQLEENSAPVTDYSIIDEEQRYTSYGLLTNSDVMAATDFDSIKDHIMNTGALYISYYSYNNYYSSTYNSYYQNTYTTSNHAVTIVGWDDNFSRYNFGSSIPESDGAWICKNSWGDDWGDDGYFYLSYYDTSIQDCITSFEISDVSTYDNIYQYDGSLTQGRYYNDDAISTANIFTADSNETLSAVSFYTYEASVPYIISVYTNVEEGKPTSGKRVAVQRGTMDYEGYHVVDLNNYISLDEGTNFSIVVTLDKEGTLMWFDSCENLSDCSYYTKGVATSNSSWGDAISKFGYTACIKALTKSDILIDSDHFPDESFREFISLNFDTDHDGMLSVEEIADVTYMDAKKSRYI